MDDPKRLTVYYPNAFADFFGCDTPCILKTGPEWPTNVGPESQKFIRVARPVGEHPIAPTWVPTAWRIAKKLDELKVDWNTINPLAYANAGEESLICDFIITITVRSISLVFAAAQAAASAVEELLETAGFPGIQLAFIESIYRRAGTGPQLMDFKPLDYVEGLAALHKPFTPTLGLSIAPQKLSHYEGTGGLFFKLSSAADDKRVAVLTCAHVSQPPPVSRNDEYMRKNDSQPRKDIILLGNGSFDAAVEAIMKFIGDQTVAISAWENSRSRLAAQRGPKYDELTGLINGARVKITAANQLHNEVTKNFTTTASRVIGHVFYCAKIEVGQAGFMWDWSFVVLDEDKINWDEFEGNKMFVGGNKKVADWVEYMFPKVNDRRDYHIPEDMLLQLQGFVPENDFRRPPHLDVNGVKTLLAVKEGRSTQTTFGRVNSLESITRSYPEYGISRDALEYIVLGYDTKTAKNDKFCDPGDSGSIVADRTGRVIGLLTGGGGTTDSTDKTYLTPFYALLPEIQSKIEGCYILPPIAAVGTAT